ncbi:MAG TPA: GldG family protein [Actinomycetota bacterium]|nr:GldG family protein [Actinomycetota bacterium]
MTPRDPDVAVPRARPRAPLLLAVAAAVVVAVASVVGAERSRVQWDLTSERSATLSAETLRVLRRLDSRVRITAFFARADAGRVEAATLLSRYRRENRRISFRILDPVQLPGESQRLGAGRGSAAVESLGGDREIEVAPLPIEIDITSAIARLVRPSPGTVCFTTGHGERSVDDESLTGLSQAAKLLRDNGYTVRTAGMLSGAGGLSGCDAAVVAAPVNQPSRDAVTAITEYLSGSGKAVVLSDPLSAADLTPLVDRWGLSFEKGFVLEADPESRLQSDLVSPIVSRYTRSNPAVRGLGPTYFPGLQAVRAKHPGGRPGLAVSAVAVTSRTAYLERSLGDGRFNPETDLEGPLEVGAAADDSEVTGTGPAAGIRRTRILAWGDVDFASNQFIPEASNGRLVVQAVDWLTQPEDLVAAVPSFPKVRELELTEARSRYILYVTAIVVPGLFLIAGAFLWLVRRGL